MYCQDMEECPERAWVTSVVWLATLAAYPLDCISQKHSRYLQEKNTQINT